MAKVIKRNVVHPKMYKKVDGKLRRLEVGTEVEVSEQAAKQHGRKFVDPKAQKVLKGDKLVGGKGGDDSKVVAQLGEAMAANAKLTEDKAALEARVAELEKAAAKK